MGSTWRRAKQGLGLNLCAFVPTTRLDDDACTDSSPSSTEEARQSSDAAPATSSSHVIKLSRSLSRSSKNTCAICLASMKRGDGHAIFIAECSHSFHFNCISSNVKHGNQVCPICRAKWKDIPLQCPSLDAPLGRVRVNPVDWPQNNALVHHSPRPHPNQVPEPSVFDDDESLGHQIDSAQRIESGNRTVEIKIFPEVPSFRKIDSCDQFTALVHLKAPNSIPRQNNEADVVQVTQSPRAPIDLVTVLDISGSMAGTKLALLKRAMGFVIQNLGPNDRLAVIAFSSTACRLFPLLRMSGRGRHKALQAVNSLVANGWTNIAQGLRKGAKVMEDRREKNPVASIILLSDGKDTPNYGCFLPSSVHGGNESNFKIPVHTFGFGADHDASLMHRISEVSGGTFSFIETESVIQDAFAQCIAGLLSVVVKEFRLNIECVHPGVRVGSLRAGSYSNHIMPDGKMGFIDVGDLYADEERDFLVSINVPSEVSRNETSLLKVRCVYKDPLTKETVEFGTDKGDLVGATSVLENSRKALAMSVSAKSHDWLCIALDAELKEMQERMASRHVYEVSGRAYILSGLSSHSWQRATTRGDSTDESSLIWAYQTPSMIEMVTNSQAALLGSPSAQRLVRPVWSFGSQPNPR
nr:E3 ubiquitin-protein ligase WAV3-like [Ipomoea batatas]